MKQLSIPATSETASGWTQKIGSLLSDRKRNALLKKSVRSVALRCINWFRYPERGPTTAARFVDIYREIDRAELHVVRAATHQILPKNLVSCQLDPKQLKAATDLTFTTSFVGTLQQGHALGRQGHVLTPDGRVLTDVVTEMSRPRSFSSLTRRGRIPGQTRIRGTLAVLGCMQPDNYFHWVCDAFARIQFLQPYHDEIDAYLICADRPFQQHYLQAAGIPKKKILHPTRSTHLCADRLLFTSLPGDDANRPYRGLKDAATCQFLGDLFDLPEEPREHIFVLRRQKRAIHPENELKRIASEIADFRYIYLEDLAVDEQARIFSNAATIVSPHGAGLTNLAHCRPRTRVLEFFSPSYINTMYLTIALQRGCEYECMIGEGNRNGWNVGSDISIEPRLFRKKLETYFS